MNKENAAASDQKAKRFNSSRIPRPSTLFVKIFLWFWLATALVGLAFVVITLLTETEPLASRWREMTRDALTVYAPTVRDIYEREGREGLNLFLERMDRSSRLSSFFFNASGQELSGRTPPPGAKELAARSLTSEQVEFDFNGPNTLAAHVTSAPGGERYVLVVEIPRGRFGLRQYGPRAHLLRLTVILLTAGLFCYWLARYLTVPVKRLRDATRRLASGDLSARVGAATGKRRDELAELGRDFDLMADRLETLVTSQRRLLGDISHELRSPLARLNVALELVRQRSGPEAQGAIERIAREAERLNELIGQMLTLARLESETGSREAETIDLARLLKETAADADFEARSRNRGVNVVALEECRIAGTEQLLRSAIENVLRNAVRYTAEGTTVQVSLEMRRDGDQTPVAVISVRDYGPGVPEEKLGELFQPFYRVADARERQTGGIGLGLAITERAVRLHGGRINASNAPGGGLLMKLELPANWTVKATAQSV